MKTITKLIVLAIIISLACASGCANLAVDTLARVAIGTVLSTSGDTATKPTKQWDPGNKKYYRVYYDKRGKAVKVYE